MPAVPSAPTSSASSSPGASGAAASASAQPYQSSYRERQLPIRRSAKACVACRKAKARCDGPELWPCRRCREACHECVFEGVPKEELGTKIALAVSSEASITSTPPWSTERRLLQMEQEIAVLRRTAQEHADLFAKLEAGTSLGRGGASRPTSSDLGEQRHDKGKEREVDHRTPTSYEPNFTTLPSMSNELSVPASSTHPLMRNGSFAHVASPSHHTPSLGEVSFADPSMEQLARASFDTFWTTMAPWAPYIDPMLDTYENVRARSPLLFYCILATASQFHSNAEWAHHCEQEALKYMRATVYSDIPPVMDDLKGTLLYNAWLSRGSPPGHSCTLAAQLDLPRALERLLSAMDKPNANKAFDTLMPAVRTWLSLYAQDLWLSVATGRRGLVTIDFSITSARSLLKFEALRAVDARIIAQSELVTILGGVQENFVKTQQTSIAETVNIVQRADKHFDVWMQTWTEWAQLQEESTGQYMVASFAMQNQVGRFYINTLGLRDITSPEEVKPIQMPVIKSAIKAAYEVQLAAQGYGSKRMGSSTEFTLISCCSAALFLLKMIKLMPDLFRAGDGQDVATTLMAVRSTSKLLAEAPRQNYHLAVASALAHLESQFLTPSFGLETLTDPMLNAGASIGVNSTGSTPAHNDVLFDPELELAISSVIEESNFWSWSQAQPADSFSGLMS